MAVTTNQIVSKKNAGMLTAFGVASGETIKQNTLVIIGIDGLLYDLDTAAIITARAIGIVADDTDNSTGPAATTAAGSISGTQQRKSAIAGDKTVREVWMSGNFLLTGTGFTQASVGLTLKASDNFTTATTGDGVKIGMVTTFISSTQVWVELNTFGTQEGVLTYTAALTATTTSAAGDTISWGAGQAVYLENFILDVTTPATGAATIDIGVAANGTTTSDTLIDGLDIGTAAVYTTSLMKHIAASGSAAGQVKMASTEFITGDASATTAGLVGTFTVVYIKA